MTYAGLKSFLYAGIGRTIRRVKAALEWIRKHYTLEENPPQRMPGFTTTTTSSRRWTRSARTTADADGKKTD